MSTIPVSDIPCVSLLYKLDRLKPAESSTYTPSSTYNDKIALLRNDITKLEVDSIVNAANNSLLGGGGVDGAIHRAAGPELYDECELLDGCVTGSAKITKGYRLPAKHVIHAVGPVYQSTKRQGKHTSLLQGCYRTSLELAVDNKLKSIAFSALSTGVYGYPSDEAAETAIGEVRKFLDSGKGDSLERIVFCNFTEKDEKAYFDMIPKFFPPDQTVEKKDEESPAPTSEDLAAQLPDPPTKNPSEEGQPDAKKLKSLKES
ncbi:A1pp-domain-containing protein [Pseudovirgaria hyperparasitica]|uniref:A1pp-domain-containing protein n=1 Tax=Pseudovirgaria hyperparasitica TaxID=470096 RepID=A0A6A6VUE1_9PEZI|nr:A1pp-domain-containing protein [Pseudovirgaria hyperparasitica]KAF2752867.1 A1pp-domain-containing protein [Pseudovirgaria hyperparasitica]